MLGALAHGETVIHGLLESEDVLATARIVEALGAQPKRTADGLWRLRGVGVGNMVSPDGILDCGNSGTTARLVLGLLAGQGVTATLTGDASLRRRPMARVTEPLRACGAEFIGRDQGFLPITVVGAGEPLPLDYTLPMASAQVKSAILFAGLNAPGCTRVIEPLPTRDHSERMLRHFGAEVRSYADAAAPEGRVVELMGEAELVGQQVSVPADPSSAAFPLVAALLCADCAVVLPGVCVSPQRRGLLDTLKEMGADLREENPRLLDGEEVADISVRSSALRGVEVPAQRVPSLLDEVPILAVAAAFAQGRTRISNLGELRVKESDRLAATAQGLEACGAEVCQEQDGMIISGGGQLKGGATIAADGDHRMAMAFAVAGLAAQKPITITGSETIATSFPDFVAALRGLGAQIAYYA